MKGYKVFNPDFTCRGFQYEVGKTYEEDVVPDVCKVGFHFCQKLSDCFDYYDFNPNNKVAEIEAIGDIDEGDSKCCTNKITIVKEIAWQEVLDLVNFGKSCTGLCNTGNCNTGDSNTGNCNTGDRNTGNCNTGNSNTGNRNTGDWNTGDWNTGNSNTGNSNTGDSNTGDRNTGDWNTGNRNTGDSNTGLWNTGNRNTGDRNTGDWNKSSFNTGCFMTKEPTIMMFNKPTDWTYRNWIDSDAHHLLDCIQKNVVEWIFESDMSDEEKVDNPTYKCTGGYLKMLNESECCQRWWDSLSESNRNVIRNMPNFDAEIFKEITGIRI